MGIKQAIGTTAIEAREEAFLQRAIARWSNNPGVEIYGSLDPHHRIGIVSFNIRHNSTGKLLHPRLTTVLLNDLFGIQARGGCSCAGEDIKRTDFHCQWPL
jgi:selenocysteine lyase/cysteine desulfurase